MEEIVYHTNYIVEDTYWWFTARNLILEKILKTYLKEIKDGYILDVGCGTGGVTKFLSRNFEFAGLDFSPIALEYCRKRGLKKLYNCSLEEYNFDLEHLKAITFFDVIEHIKNDESVVKTAYDLLPKNGRLIATVPAYQWLWSKHDQMHQHYRRYNKQNFSQLISKAGFKINYISYFNSSLLIPGAAKRIIEKVFNIEKDINEPVDKVSPFLNRLFHHLFAFERHFLPSIQLPFGLSLIVVAEK